MRYKRSSVGSVTVDFLRLSQLPCRGTDKGRTRAAVSARRKWGGLCRWLASSTASRRQLSTSFDSHTPRPEYVKTWLNFPTQSLNPSTILKALQLRERFQISYWDAAIIAAAQELGCRTIFSEDLSHAQDYDGVVVMNPFLLSVET